MRNWVFLGIASVALVGCAGIKVTKPSPEKLKEYGAIDGLPFYIKVPICVHETKWIERQLVATVAYDEKGPGGKSVKAERSIVIADTPAAIAELQKALDVSGRPGPMPDASTVVAEAAQRFRPGQANTDAFRDLNAKPMSNGWETKMVIGSEPYYVTSQAPLFGSSNTTFKFNDEGALTDASSDVSDDTAKTLLGLLPIADKLAIQWKTKLAPTTQNAADPTKYSTMKIIQLGRATSQPGPSFEVTFKPLSTIVTSRRVSGGTKYRTSICGPDYASAKASEKEHAPWLDENQPDVQVVRETVGESAKKEGDDDSPAYKINGSITLPKAK